MTEQNLSAIVDLARHFDIWLEQSTFSQTHKVGNNDINADLVFPYISRFIHFLDLRMLVNVKLDAS